MQTMADNNIATLDTVLAIFAGRVSRLIYVSIISKINRPMPFFMKSLRTARLTIHLPALPLNNTCACSPLELIDLNTCFWISETAKLMG